MQKHFTGDQYDLSGFDSFISDSTSSINQNRLLTYVLLKIRRNANKLRYLWEIG